MRLSATAASSLALFALSISALPSGLAQRETAVSTSTVPPGIASLLAQSLAMSGSSADDAPSEPDPVRHDQLAPRRTWGTMRRAEAAFIVGAELFKDQFGYAGRVTQKAVLEQARRWIYDSYAWTFTGQEWLDAYNAFLTHHVGRYEWPAQDELRQAQGVLP